MKAVGKAALGEVATFIRGVTFKPDDVVDLGTPDAIACFRTKNVQEEIDLTDVWAISESFVKRSDKLVREGDLLVSTANSWNLVGKCSWVPALPWPATLGGFISALRPDRKLIDPRYLYWWFSGAETQATVRNCARQTTNIANLSLERCEALILPLPPLQEQRRIAAILDQADALRRLRRQSLVKVARLMTSIVERAEGKDGKLIPLSEGFWFQEGPGVRNWQFVDDGVKLLNVSNVTKENTLEPERSKNRVSFEEANGKYAHFLVDVGDLIMPCSGIPIDPDGLLTTRSAFAEAHHLPLCMNTSTIRFKALRTAGDLIFLRGWLQTYEFRKQITKLVTGTAQKNFGPSHLKQLKITLPSLATVEALKREMLALDKQRQLAVAAAEALDSLFTSLQHRAFRGEL